MSVAVKSLILLSAYVCIEEALCVGANITIDCAVVYLDMGCCFCSIVPDKLSAPHWASYRSIGLEYPKTTLSYNVRQYSIQRSVKVHQAPKVSPTNAICQTPPPL